jgi:beta-glucosidase
MTASPFKAIDAGTDTVMASFNTINGVPVTANRGLITDLLKDEMGFRGIVMSDFAAIGELINHGVAADLAEAARKAMLASIDLDMEGKAYDKHLEAELAAGRVPMRPSTKRRRILRVKFQSRASEKTHQSIPEIDEAKRAQDRTRRRAKASSCSEQARTADRP